MKKLLSAAAVLVLTLVLAPSLQAAEPPVQGTLEPNAECHPYTPLDNEIYTVVAAAQAKRERPARDPIQVNDKSSLTRVLFDECDNWACWQNPDPPLCACEGFWCGPIFICGTPCGPGGC